MSEQGRKFDGGKLRYDLVPVLAFEDAVKGLTYGATKYDDDNWKDVPYGRKRYLAAAMRHLQEYRKGNLWDEEQGIHHLSAAINNFSFIVEKDLQGWEDIQEVKEVEKEPLKLWCECCQGVGSIDERLGGYSFSNPAAECPDCEGEGYIEVNKKRQENSVENEWIEWNGGERPVDVFVRVSVKFRDGTQNDGNAACNWYWGHVEGFEVPSDIVAYKVLD